MTTKATKVDKPEVLIKHVTILKDTATDKSYLHGQFWGHHNQYNCPNGSWGHTTKIEWIDKEAGIAETMNTLYTIDSYAKVN